MTRYQVERRTAPQHVWRVVLSTPYEREARDRFLALSTAHERGEVRLVDTHDGSVLSRVSGLRTATS